jgi:hypothetical protein
MSSTHELLVAYLAGIVDGEGYIGLTKNKGTYGPRLLVGMTDKIVIDLLHETFGGRLYEDKVRSGRVLYRWHVVNKADLERILSELLPHLRAKRAQAELVLEFVRGYEDQRHRPAITQQELQRRFDLYCRVKPLNAVGASALSATH